MAIFNLTPTDNIQVVIDNDANSGDTIRLAAGIYSQSIMIGMNKNSIRIIGAGIEKTIFEGTELGLVNGIDIQASSMVTIENLTVQNFNERGILIQTSDNIINKVKSQNNQNNGMEISTVAERNLIMESESNNNGSNEAINVDGIQVNGEHNYIVKCKFIGNSNDGMELKSSNNLVFLNLAKDNGSEGYASDSDVDSDDFNLFICNQSIRNRDDGFEFDDSNLLLWNKALVNNDDGLEINGDHNLLWGNEVKCNTEDGIDLGNHCNNRLLRNNVLKNGIQQIDSGIEIEGGDGNIVDYNTVLNHVHSGILVGQNAESNVVRSNCLKENNPDIQAVPPASVNTLFNENNCTTSDPNGLCQINNFFNVPGDFDTIQEAIDAVPEEGFTIQVGAGIFKEAITINNTGQVRNKIRIVGVGREKTIIDGTDTIDEIGIDIEDASFITIENLTVQNFDSFGIRVNTSDNVLHCVNVFGNQNSGIFITGLNERNMVMKCESSQNIGIGISVNGDHNYIVCSQCSRNNGEGIRFNSGEFNLAYHNFCDGNQSEGIEPAGDNNFIISNCTLNNSDGIEVDDDHNLLLWNKSFRNQRDGINVEDSNNLVWGNVCYNNERNGIFVEENNNLIIYNHIKNNNDEGIRIEDNDFLPSANFNMIDNNIIINNKKAGILLAIGSDNNIVRSNCLFGNPLDIDDQGTDNILDEN
ncbi:right-handed parallel beta-helix repeat-containing protein [Chengkuizengella sediminis]|uniref:right-handed parallel beta-helix repeat-containing protein n=1 Tax=Chengkuizengella sediminis TaxID=1885917 RepID=UPI0013895600|nr:right-handed parallel beta-helix repeat-containing protein [Chengkuizengella sediminis]NDI33267.1 hypothetical protein [Chengkuizengella sediminis]